MRLEPTSAHTRSNQYIGTVAVHIWDRRIKMRAVGMITGVLVITTVLGQLTSKCNSPTDTSCSAKLASRERSAIIDRVGSAMEVMSLQFEEVERFMSAIMPRLIEIERKLSDYASRFETIESQNSDIQQEQRCSSFEKMFRQNGNRQYMLGLSRLSWAQARERCHQCGYSLARIESYDEQQYIRKWLTDIDTGELTNPTGSSASIWTDGTDHSHEGCWVWTYPRVSLFSTGYTAWHSQQPDNKNNNEHCNCLWIADEWKWNDNVCHSKLIFLCKKVNGEAVTALPSLDEIKTTTIC